MMRKTLLCILAIAIVAGIAFADSYTPGTLNLTVSQGEDYHKTLVLKDSSATPINLTGWGGVIRTWTRVSGTNVANGGDGGSGMSDLDSAAILVYDGTVTMEFRAYGGNGYSATALGWLKR